jgi:hypothetical protein
MTNFRTRRAGVTLLGGLLVSALCIGTAAASAPAGGFSSTRINSKGTFFAVMSDSNSTFCFMTGMKVEETDTLGESAQCRILAQNGRWVLETTLGKDGDATVVCEARCYTNN